MPRSKFETIHLLDGLKQRAEEQRDAEQRFPAFEPVNPAVADLGATMPVTPGGAPAAFGGAPASAAGGGAPVAIGVTPDPRRSFLIGKFREFYSEVIRLKRLVRDDPSAFVPITSGEYAPDSGPAQAARAISARLQSLLEQQALEAGRRGGEQGSRLYREAQYVMAALADDVFLNLEWDGRRHWPQHLLEWKLFGSHVAGEQVFARADRLLEERNPVLVEVAAVSLMALALGFQGRFRGTREVFRIDDYRRRLFSMVFRRDASLLTDETPLFPEAYAHTLASGTAAVLPTARPWLAALAVLLVLYLGASHLVWRNVTAEMRQLNERIERIATESLRS